MKNLAWLFSAISILACWLNVKKDKRCFLIWMVSNIGFIVVNIGIGLYGQIPLWVAFCAINVYGYRQWSKDEIADWPSKKSLK